MDRRRAVPSAVCLFRPLKRAAVTEPGPALGHGADMQPLVRTEFPNGFCLLDMRRKAWILEQEEKLLALKDDKNKVKIKMQISLIVPFWVTQSMYYWLTFAQSWILLLLKLVQSSLILMLNIAGVSLSTSAWFVCLYYSVLLYSIFFPHWCMNLPLNAAAADGEE